MKERSQQTLEHKTLKLNLNPVLLKIFFLISIILFYLTIQVLRRQLFEIYPNTSVAEDARDNEVKLSAEKKNQKNKTTCMASAKKTLMLGGV